MFKSQQDLISPHQSLQLLALRRQLEASTAEACCGKELTFSSGLSELDTILPDGGLRAGQLVEWFGEGRGSGAGTLALRACWQAASSAGMLVVLDRAGMFYPPAAATLGVDLKKLILVRAGSAQEEFWALDQALRSREVAATWAVLGACDSRRFRRLQLSAEQGETLGCLVRSSHRVGQPSWSQLQLLVQPAPAPVSPQPDAPQPWQQAHTVTLLRCQGADQENQRTVTCPW